MAQIVMVDQNTACEGICEIDDIIAIYDDYIDLSGPEYSEFKIINVVGKTMPELRNMWQQPEQQTVIKIPRADTWTFIEEKDVWKNSNGDWCDLINKPKHTHSLRDLTEADIANLESAIVSIADKDIILAKCSEKIHLDATNNIAITDLNAI